MTKTIHYCLDCENYVYNYAEHNADHSIQDEVLYTKKEFDDRFEQGKLAERQGVIRELKAFIAILEIPETLKSQLKEVD